MEPIIAIIGKNISNSNAYAKKDKVEYITTINRIYLTKKRIEQLYRSMEYALLFSVLIEEINFLTKQQEYFCLVFDKNISDVLDEFFSREIKYYNHMLQQL